MLREEDVRRFKEIYERDYGEEITLDEAWQMAEAVVRFYRAVDDSR